MGRKRLRFGVESELKPPAQSMDHQGRKALLEPWALSFLMLWQHHILFLGVGALLHDKPGLLSPPRSCWLPHSGLPFAQCPSHSPVITESPKQSKQSPMGDFLPRWVGQVPKILKSCFSPLLGNRWQCHCTLPLAGMNPISYCLWRLKGRN